ncbi:MAG: hypothetical protein ACLSAH_04690 [Bilophila wadsworthia]
MLGAAKAVRSGKIGMERLAALPDDEAWVPCVRCGAWMCALPCAY